MADIGRGVRTYLAAQAAVSSLVGTRIYPDALPQDATRPALVFTVISSVGEHHLTAAAGIARAIVQIDCYADTRLAANALSEAVRGEMQGYRGAMGSEYVQCCHLQNRIYDYDTPEHGSDQGLYRVIMEWLIWHTESVPTFS